MNAARALCTFQPLLRSRHVYHQRSLGILSPSRRKDEPRVAVLYQAVEPPVVNGVRKPKKPGGYQDSGADIAYVLRSSGHTVLTPSSDPSPLDDSGWCFPDTERGILSAINLGATHLWANTILFGSHPLQAASSLDKRAKRIKVVGQPPLLVDEYDDKNFVNALLRKDGRFRLPDSRILNCADPACVLGLTCPIVGKPIRGRGSHGVRVCHTEPELCAHLEVILKESPLVMVEEFLSGEEGTVTVMPPSPSKSHGNPDDGGYYALPLVTRFNHASGIAPYSGTISVTQNSRLPFPSTLSADPAYSDITTQCVQVAAKLRVTAPIRIDVRGVSEVAGAPFAMFDVNMKPNMTGPGRPGREDQASLTALAAGGLGWDYARLLKEVLGSAKTLEWLRGVYL